MLQNPHVTIPCACHAKRHFNVQKWRVHVVLCRFWLGHVLRATTACTFSTSQLLKVLRGWGVLDVLTWKCASRHNSVQLFIFYLTTWLRTRRFSEPTFRPSGATKNTVFRDVATFSHTWIFLLQRLYLFDLLSSLFFSYSSHLCFSSVHIVGSLTSKLPSIICIPISIPISISIEDACPIEIPMIRVSRFLPGCSLLRYSCSVQWLLHGISMAHSAIRSHRGASFLRRTTSVRVSVSRALGVRFPEFHMGFRDFGSSILRSIDDLYLVGGWALPLWKIMEFVSWDDDIPNWMGK